MFLQKRIEFLLAPLRSVRFLRHSQKGTGSFFPRGRNKNPQDSLRNAQPSGRQRLSIPWMLVCHSLTHMRPKHFQILHLTKKQYVLKEFSWAPLFHQYRMGSPDTNPTISLLNTTFTCQTWATKSCFLMNCCHNRGDDEVLEWHAIYAFSPIFSTPSPVFTEDSHKNLLNVSCWSPWQLGESKSHVAICTDKLPPFSSPPVPCHELQIPAASTEHWWLMECRFYNCIDVRGNPNLM